MSKYLLNSFKFLIVIPIALFIISLTLLSNKAYAVEISDSGIVTDQPPSMLELGISEAGLGRLITDNTGSEFYFVVNSINGVSCNNITFKTKCIEHNRPSCAAIQYFGNSVGSYYKVYAYFTGDIDSEGYGLYDVDVPGNIWGACTYDKATSFSQQFAGDLVWDHFQTSSTRADGRHGKASYLRFKQVKRYRQAKYLTYASQDNPNKVILPNDPLTPDFNGYNKACINRNGYYYGKSSPIGENSFDYSQTVHSEYQNITYEGTSWDAKVDGYYQNSSEWNDQFYVTPPETWTETIHYKANTPPIIQTKYTPFNLNYNTYAKDTDNIGHLPNEFYDKEKLVMQVDNKVGTNNGELLKTLDINNDFDFNVDFLNEFIGMPNTYNWYNDPPQLENDSWEDSNHSLPYANGYHGEGVDRYYRWNTTFNARIDDSMIIDYEGNPLCVASLVYKDEEYLYDNPLIENNKIPHFNGGLFKTRFILNGEYTTGNGNKDTNCSEWWSNTYDQGKFYEYGTEYRGYIDSYGIYYPTLLNGCQSSTNVPWGNKFSYSGQNIYFETDGLTNRALYVGLARKNFEQPVLFAKWEVKTLAGDTRY